MTINRDLFAVIDDFLTAKQAIVVTGMRRVGKTTLLNYFYNRVNSSNKLLLDLEDPLNRAIFDSKNYDKIRIALERRGINFAQKAYIFLDEIQFARSVPSIVKYYYDHYDVKFFLTGSASYYLKNLFSESLSGRKILFELFPLCFAEFLRFKNARYKLPRFTDTIDQDTHLLFTPLIEEYLEWGGMPEIVLIKDRQQKEAVLRDIFSSYFRKDVEALGDFSKNVVMRNLILLLSRRVGQKVDIQRISQELGVARQTIYEYLGFLSGTYFIYLLPALGDIDVVVRKQRKIYLMDTGFFSFLETPATGSVFENACYLNLRTKGPLYYWQSKQQEVDFVLKDQDSRKHLFEVKETAVTADINRLKRLEDKLKAKTSFLVSLNFSANKNVKYLYQLWNLKL